MSDIVLADSYLTLHYRLALAAGDAPPCPSTDLAQDASQVVVDTFEARPATLQMGNGQLAPGLEEKLIGMRAGDSGSFLLEASEAFGPRNPQMVQKMSRAAFDSETAGMEHAVETGAGYQAGDIVEFSVPGGERHAGVLKELNERHALFDFNHPLAGQRLRFEVRIIGIL